MTAPEKKNRTTAIIPNYNGADFLRPCLDALLAQQPAPPDIIVVDNRSADDSESIVTNEYPGARFIKMDTNAGFAKAVNRGIQEADTEFVALVNNDTEVWPGWLAALEAFMDATPEAAACAPKVIFHTGENIIDSAGDAVTPYGYAYKIGHFETDDGRYDQPREVFAVSAVATIYRMSMFDTAGLFEEEFFAYYEDIDICFRARLAGMKFFYNPAAATFHHYSATSGSKMKLGSEEVYIHLTGVWIKNLPRRLWLKHLPSILLYHTVICAAVALARARGRARLPRVPVFRLLRSMLRKRKAVQASAKVSPAEIESLMSSVSVWQALGTRFLKFTGR